MEMKNPVRSFQREKLVLGGTFYQGGFDKI